jgi:predicted molibdopterin-dependent oxidoreductase YjgC
MLQHVSLEVSPDQVDDCVAFWSLLGFARVDPPPSLRERAAWVERDGTFTNFQGRVQRFRPAVEPLGEALPEWDIIGRILRGLGDPPGATRPVHWFRDLAQELPAFAGMTYQTIGDTGLMIAEQPEAAKR